MNRKFFIILCVIFFVFILCFFGYKIFNGGNNKNIEDAKQAEEYVLNIKNYTAQAKVTINSNKNSNTYNLKQSKKDDYQKQEIISDDQDQGIVIENEGEKIIIKNTNLSLEKVFEKYEDVAKNAVGLDSFIDDYNSSDEREVTEDDNYYMLFVKKKNSKNKYNISKTLFINKSTNKIEKIEVKDVNNNRTIFIEYTELKIL